MSAANLPIRIHVGKVNESVELLNQFIQDDNSKIQSLTYSATDEEIVKKQEEIRFVATALDNAVRMAIESKAQTASEPDTLQKAEMDVVESRNGVQAENKKTTAMGITMLPIAVTRQLR